MCSHTPFSLVSLNDENFMIKVLVSALSEVANCSSIALSNARTLVCFYTEPRKLAEILVLMNITLRRFDHSHRSWSTFSSLVLFINFRFIFPYDIVNVNPSQIKKDSFLQCFIIATTQFRDITSNIRVICRLHNCIS